MAPVIQVKILRWCTTQDFINTLKYRTANIKVSREDGYVFYLLCFLVCMISNKILDCSRFRNGVGRRIALRRLRTTWYCKTSKNELINKMIILHNTQYGIIFVLIIIFRKYIFPKIFHFFQKNSLLDIQR